MRRRWITMSVFLVGIVSIASCYVTTRYGNLSALNSLDHANRLIEYHLHPCQVTAVDPSEGQLLVHCADGGSVHFYMPLQCEEDSLLCALGFEAACWEVIEQQ